jgi:hypothetical protein
MSRNSNLPRFVRRNPGSVVNANGKKVTVKRMFSPRRVLDWAVEMFGPAAKNRDERAARVVEEAIELAQACGLPPDVVTKIVNRVYAKDHGDLRGEFGQLQMVLYAFAANENLNADTEADIEFHRVSQWPKSHWDKRHAQKVKDGIANLSPVAPTLHDEVQ